MTGPDSVIAALAEDVRQSLDEVLAQGREGRWEAASRCAAELVASLHRLQIEVDFRSMSRWLEKAKAA